MNKALFRRCTLLWFGLFALAFLNGALREVAIKQVLREPFAHHLSALTGVLLFTAYGLLVWGKSRVTTARQAAWVGGYWLVLTVLTETFVLNRWISKLSWEQILATYNVAAGELWPLVVLWIGLLPSALHAWNNRRRATLQ